MMMGRVFNNCKVNKTLLNNYLIKEEIREKIKRFLESKENEETNYRNLWDTAKIIPRGKFIVIENYLGKEKNIKGTI